MAEVLVALGSNLNDRHTYLREAGAFLKDLSTGDFKCSSIYESEPVGPSEFEFLNAVILIETDLSPIDLLQEFKDFEKMHGRPTRYPKWTARTIDLDIIGYDNLVIEQDRIVIPHPLYHERLFVLKPMQEVAPSWKDPVSEKGIDELILAAPAMKLTCTSLSW